jgi:hypothetical protein
MNKIFAIVIIALSVNSFGQQQQLSSQFHKRANSYTLDSHLYSSSILTPGLAKIISNRNAANRNNREKDQTVLIADSTYWWSLDTLLPGMKLTGKSIDFMYDANNNEIGYTVQKLNGSVWLNATKYNLSYDANNNLTIYSYQQWDGLTWQNYYLNADSYDINNNQISSDSEFWDGNKWLIVGQSLLTYNTNNDCIENLSQDWDGSSMVNTFRTIRTSDTNHNCISILGQTWDGSSWNDHWHDNYTYDTNNNNTTYVIQIWQNNSWIITDSSYYTYDSNNNRTHYLWKRWNGSVWLNENKYDYTYDANNNLTGTICQLFKGSDWIDFYSEFKTYDADNFPLSSSYKYWNDAGTKITMADSSYYFFHSIYTGLNVLNETSFTLYPNPATNKITISTKDILPGENSLSIVGMNGLYIKQAGFQNQNLIEMNVSSLPDGIYLVKIKTNTGIRTKKLLIRH